MTLQRHMQQPPIITGYILNPDRGHWAIEVPSEQTNWIDNPSSETNTSNWIGSGGATAVSQSSAWAYSGLYSTKVLGVFGNTAAIYSQSSVPAGTYRYSCALYAPAGARLWIDITGTAFDAGRLEVTLPPGEVVIAHFPIPIAVPGTSTFDIYFQVVDSAVEFYVDAQLLESGVNFSPFFDGNSPGCYWLGLPDLSASYRTLEANSGAPTNLHDLGIYVDQYSGASMPNLDAQSTEYAILDGNVYDGTRVTDRILALSLRFSGSDQMQVQRQKAALIDLINRDRAAGDIPVTLIYQAYKCDQPIGKPLRSTAVYIGGLEGNTDNLYAEQSVIQFRHDDPFFYEAITSGTTMPVYDTFALPRIARYDRNHIWSTMGGGPDNGLVRAIRRGVDGYLYVGGSFTSVNGIPLTRYLARWREDVGWQSVGNFAIGGTAEVGVHSIIMAANGDVMIGGDFTGVDGLLSTANIARYKPYTNIFLPVVTNGANLTVRAMAYDNTGALYIGGNFTSIGGIAANYIAKLTAGVIGTVGTGMNAAVYALATDSINNVYVGGVFTLASATAVNRIAYWNAATSTWGTLSGGVATVTVGTLAVFAITLANGLVYVGGNFVTAGGITVNHIAVWTGTAWQAIGPTATPGVTSSSTLPIRAITAYKNMIYVGGNFTAAGGSAWPYVGYALWNGYTWLRGDIDAPSTPTMYAIHADDRGVTLGFDQSGTGIFSKTQAITSTATSTTRPVFTLKNIASSAQRLYQILNATTGDYIFFDLLILPGETIIIDTRQRRITSTTRGDLTYTILTGSTFATWKFLPGQINYVNVFGGGAGNTMAVTMNNAHWTVEGAVFR